MMSSKYAALPDLDTSQDIYETPDLVSNVSTIQSVTGPPTDPDNNLDIEEFSVSVAAAAARFRDTTERITDKRRGHRRRQQYQQSRNEAFYGDDGSEVNDSNAEEREEETVESRLARLKRELEEVRAIVKEREENGEARPEEVRETEKGIDELAKAMGLLTSTDEDADGRGAQKRLVRRMAVAMGSAATVTNKIPTPTVEDAPETVPADTTQTYTVTYSPEYKKAHTLSMIAEFDTRLASLEKVLGISVSALSSADDQLPQQAMIPTLNELQRQMAILNSSSTASLDAAKSRVKALVAEAEKLTDARIAAKAAKSAFEPTADPLENDEMVNKINALYGILPTIENLAPLLPTMLDRLRTLRLIHQDAARASEALNEIEQKQEDMEVEMKKWEEALVKVEGVMKETTGTMEGNVGKVEGWIKTIEEKMKKVEQMQNM